MADSSVLRISGSKDRKVFIPAVQNRRVQDQVLFFICFNSFNKLIKQPKAIEKLIE